MLEGAVPMLGADQTQQGGSAKAECAAHSVLSNPYWRSPGEPPLILGPFTPTARPFPAVLVPPCIGGMPGSQV